MLLQDRSTYGAALLNRQLQDISSGASFTDYSVAFAIDGLRNDVTVGADGGIIRHLVFSFPFRGSLAIHQMTLANANMPACLSQAPFLAPGLTFVDGFLPAQ
jgi:hypothetical protein